MSYTEPLWEINGNQAPVITADMSQYVSGELGSYPVWDSSVLYQAPPPTHPHVNDHGLYRQPCALLHQSRYTSNGRSPNLPSSTSKKPRRRVATVSQRRAANIRERRRMFNLNEAFDKLRRKSYCSSLAGLRSVAYVNVPTQEVAKRFARGLVKNKLAACVNIVPGITSVKATVSVSKLKIQQFIFRTYLKSMPDFGRIYQSFLRSVWNILR